MVAAKQDAARLSRWPFSAAATATRSYTDATSDAIMPAIR
jgi:hypothetical protein